MDIFGSFKTVVFQLIGIENQTKRPHQNDLMRPFLGSLECLDYLKYDICSFKSCIYESISLQILLYSCSPAFSSSCIRRLQ